MSSKVKGVEIGDGGNIQNIIANLTLALTCSQFRERLQSNNIELKLTVASSSDPFASFPKQLADTMRQICDVYLLDIPDRFAIQVPWEEDEGNSGTLAIASEPLRTGKALEALIEQNKSFKKAFKQATCFVSADPIYDQLATHANPPHVYIINASTAFRALVAATSYNRCTILPMNNDEAADVCRLLLHRGTDEELDKISRPPFHSPLSSSGQEIDMGALRQLDESLYIFRSFNPPHRTPGQQTFVCPISFGAQGGLVISTGRPEFACFTSTPELESPILTEFGIPEESNTQHIHEVGAGDSVAAITTLFNAIEPRIFIAPHLEGREPQDRQLTELASTIFVSTLGRIVGLFLVRTKHTNWSNMGTDMFFHLCDEVAKESLYLARATVRKLHAPGFGNIKRWGIQTVIWKPGQIAFPERESHA